MKRIAFSLLLLCLTVMAVAQDFQVYSVRGNVRRVKGTTLQALSLRDVVHGSDVLDIPMHAALVLVDLQSGVQVTLTKAGHATAKAMAKDTGNTVAKVSAKYLSYIQSQLQGQEYRQVRNCSDPATVTRALKVAGEEDAGKLLASTNAYEDFRVAYNSEAEEKAPLSLDEAWEAARRQLHDSFNREREKMYEDFENFRRQSMDEMLAFMSNPWEEAEAAEDKRPKEQNTVPPRIAPAQPAPRESKPVTISKVVAQDEAPAQPLPPGRIREASDKDCRTVAFSFYGTEDCVRFNTEKAPRLKGVTESGVTDFLKALTASRYDNLLVDCLTLRSKYALSDWAYLQMLKAIAEACYGKGSNDATLLLAYLYCQSGYKMRLGHDGERIHMLFAAGNFIFDRTYIEIEGEKYYGIEPLPRRLFACKAKYPREQQMSLCVTTNQQFAMDMSEGRAIASERYPEVKVETHVNRNLLDFYTSYPTSYDGVDVMSRWVLYASTPMQRELAETLYPQLRQQLEGLSQLEQVERILNLIQTGLPYAYDNEVWGQDRVFFAEESLFYPGCDCEDRSILLSRIVRDVLGLKCLLVHYPGHLAAAVHFDEEVAGDYISYKGEKYIICDPTYIRANVGMTMTDMDNREAEIVLLDK